MVKELQPARRVESLRCRVEYVRGVTYKASSDLHPVLDDTSYVLLRANNIQCGKLVFDDVQYVDRSKVKSSQLLKKGDILICASSGSKGLVGKAAFVKEDMPVTFGAFCCVIRPTRNEAEYLGHYFQSKLYRRTIEKASSGSNINNLKAENFYSLIVPSYTEGDARYIACILDEVESHIEALNNQLILLDSLVKSQFVEVLGDPCDSERWPMVPLGALYDVKSSKRIYAREQVKEGVPFYRLADIGNLIDGKRADSGLFISDERFDDLANSGYVPIAGDILVTARGTLGRCYVIRASDRFYFQDGMITWLSQTEASPMSDYLVQIFRNNEFFSQLCGSCSGTTVKYLSISDLAKMRIPMPPIELQQQLIDFAQRVDKSKSIARKQIEKLQLLYGSLAQEYFGD